MKRKFTGSVLATVGFLLSPLSWWNDVFINLPLALLFAWLVSAPAPAAWHERVFEVAVVLGYWLTNLIGFLLMHRGIKILFSADAKTVVRRELAKDVAISLGYTALIVLLIKLGALKPVRLFFD